MLADTGTLPGVQRGNYREGGHQPARPVVHRDRVEHGLVVASLRGHHAATRLEDGIEARVRRERPCRAVPHHGTRDDSWIDQPQVLVVDVETGGDPAPEVVHDDIRGPDESIERLHASRRLEVDNDAPLATVPAREPERRRAQGIALGGFDLDNVRAIVGEHGWAKGTGDDRAHVQHADACERPVSRSGGSRGCDGQRRGGPPECSLKRRVPHRPRDGAGHVGEFRGHTRN